MISCEQHLNNLTCRKKEKEGKNDGIIIKYSMKTFKKWLETFDFNNEDDPNNEERNLYNLPRKKLDFNKLNRKAFKITHPPDESDPTGKTTEYNSHDWSFSCVTPFNSCWNHWSIKPAAEKYVAKTDWLNGKQGNGLPNLDDAKYKQIVMSAQRLGLM